MSNRLTSRVFVLIRTLKAELERAGWPAHPTTGRSPKVGFASVDAQTGSELVVLRTVEPESTGEWVSMPGGREETILLEIFIATMVGEKTEEDVLDRLEDLAEVVQGVLRDPTTGLPVQMLGPQIDPSGGQVSDITLTIAPGGPSTFVGDCTLRVQWLTRI